MYFRVEDGKIIASRNDIGEYDRVIYKPGDAALSGICIVNDYTVVKFYAYGIILKLRLIKVLTGRYTGFTSYTEMLKIRMHGVTGDARNTCGLASNTLAYIKRFHDEIVHETINESTEKVIAKTMCDLFDHIKILHVGLNDIYINSSSFTGIPINDNPNVKSARV